MEISNKIIRKLRPCYDPAIVGIPDDEVLSATDWVAKYRETVKSEADIVWLFTWSNLMSDKDLRLFAVWCAREALKFIENPDPRSVMACDVAERYANGDATTQELSAAWSAAEYATRSASAAAWGAAGSAAWCASWSATRAASVAAAEHAAVADSLASWHAARSAQVDKLLTYLK